MNNQFFEQPIINSPYAYPGRHWELDDQGQPTQRIVEKRRRAEFLTPIPKPRRQKGAAQQGTLGFGDGKGLSTEEQQYEHAAIINGVREQIDRWRQLPESQWRVTPQTARLLKHWRYHEFSDMRPFFCQIEAVETAIWLTEVAPQIGKTGQSYIDHLADANDGANPNLLRIALKLATGAGKTTVMAMLIAWQAVNAARRPQSSRFTRGFLVVAPGITIRDRLRVLQPNDPDNYYVERELVPTDLVEDLYKARIVIKNYHAFKRRETMDLSKGGRALLEGRHGEPVNTIESEGEMLQRVVPELMGMKNVLVLNDEAHHCYREKPGDPDEEKLKGEEKQEAKKNTEAARLWITGLETVQRHLGSSTVFDLSATPFFLAGSGYAEGTLFPWTMSDFSLMDAIECGIVKLPRVPVDDNIPSADMPIYRNLWEHIGKDMPKQGRGKQNNIDPLNLPTLLQTALQALYGHYAQTAQAWDEAGMRIPPCFIIVCNNTATSKLVYDYISGFERTLKDSSMEPVPGQLPLFRNHDEHGNPLARPRTLLIDSEQLESGEALDKRFRDVASAEIEHFKRQRVERSGNPADANNITEQELLREVMNTVGKPGQLGADIRCVVSVSMLTEGWDANNVTHVIGVRAFGTQLLCEQVIGRALRRESYEVDTNGLLEPRYADVLGIPFDFTAEPVVAPPQKPKDTIRVEAVRPGRDALAIRFPRVAGYRVDLPDERLTATFNDDAILELTPELIGPAKVQVAGIVGEQVTLNLIHTREMRQSTVVYQLTRHLMDYWRDPGEPLPTQLFGQLKRIARRWLDECLVCKGGTYPAQLLYQQIADMAAQRIIAAITHDNAGSQSIKTVLDSFNPTGSTRHVGFNTSKTERYETAADRCHINWVILDSGWEAEFCRVAEAHDRVLAYVKNHNLGLEVPYRHGGDARTYIPDFIVLVDDGAGADDPLHLIVEIKGYRGEDAKAKKTTTESYWVPGVNNLGSYGRWAFAEFADVYEMQDDFAERIEQEFDTMVAQQIRHAVA
jgi:type III restriction enzyme